MLRKSLGILLLFSVIFEITYFSIQILTLILLSASIIAASVITTLICCKASAAIIKGCATRNYEISEYYYKRQFNVLGKIGARLLLIKKDTK